MKKVLLASLLAAVGSANAAVVTLDDFSVAQAAVVDTTVGGTAPSSTVAIGGGVNRTITVDLLQPNVPNLSAGAAASAGVAGEFQVNNGSGSGGVGANSNVTLAWTFANSVLAGIPVTYAQVVMESTFFNSGTPLGPITGSLGSQTRGRTDAGQYVWTVTPSQLAAGQTLSLLFQGTAGWDFSANLLNLQYTCVQGVGSNGGTVATDATIFDAARNADGCTPTRVPLPGTVALLGIGMLGVAAVRRFKRA
jgi:hypothetical protein